MRFLTRIVAGCLLSGAVVFGSTAQGSGGAAALAPAGCAVPDYLAANGPGSRTGDGYYEYQAWIANPASQAALDRLQDLLAARFGLTQDSGDVEALAGGLIGLGFDHQAQVVHVIVDPALVDVGALARDARAAVASARGAPALRIAVHAGCFSARALGEARSVLDGLGAGFAPNGWGFYLDAADSTYHVTISPDDAQAAAILGARLGGRVTIDLSGVALADRLNDGEPHWGGAGIRPGSLSSNNCTSAFTVRLPNGNLGSVTAGHCFVDSGAINGRNVYSGNQFYGETAGAFDYPSYDMVRITPQGETFDNKIHVDPCCPSVRTVVASGNPAVGDFICNSGMTTRAICGLEVRAIDQTVCFSDGGCRVHMIRVTRSGDVIVRGGDSGGPMYNRFGDTQAAARGMIIGRSSDGTIGYGHRISAVTGHLSVSVATS